MSLNQRRHRRYMKKITFSLLFLNFFRNFSGNYCSAKKLGFHAKIKFAKPPKTEPRNEDRANEKKPFHIWTLTSRKTIVSSVEGKLSEIQSFRMSGNKLFLSAANGQRPRNYLSCCFCCCSCGSPFCSIPHFNELKNFWLTFWSADCHSTIWAREAR